jgi:ferredoxin
MTSNEKLTAISSYTKCICQNCGIPSDKCPKGMYTYTKLSDDNKTISYVICAICIIYEGIHQEIFNK